MKRLPFSPSSPPPKKFKLPARLAEALRLDRGLSTDCLVESLTYLTRRELADLCLVSRRFNAIVVGCVNNGRLPARHLFHSLTLSNQVAIVIFTSLPPTH